jgi:alkanesulfonate monooxygenase SsuD/methylene tetrahydromethanopterin reductase-like flavin-dependent oxidoreductase (luciferase family)
LVTWRVPTREVFESESETAADEHNHERNKAIMKCSLFTEIQCPAGFSPVERLAEFMDQAELADRLNYDTYWVAEIHCQPQFSILSAPYVALGAVAQRTKKLRLGVAVNTLPVHHPVQLAEQAAMLDLVSGGRMEFACGGGHPHSRAYECFGVDHKGTHDVMAEAMVIIRKAWTDPVLAYNGKYFQIPEVIVNPKPVQKPLPPFWMATSSLDGVEVGARLGVNMFLPIHTRMPDQVHEFADAYWAGLKKHGHELRTRALGLLVPMHIAASTAEARQRAQDGVMSYFKTILDLRLDYTDWLNRRGVELPARLRTAAGAMVGYETVCEKHAVIGDAPFAVEKLKALCQRTGATQLLCWFNIGTMPNADVKDSMQRFAVDVMPKL